MSSNFIAVILVTLAAACTAGGDEVVAEGEQGVVSQGEYTWTDGSEADKAAPGEEDQIARYYPDDHRLEVLEDHANDAIAALAAERVFVQPVEDLNIVEISIAQLAYWWPTVICDTPYYTVYKNAYCGLYHPGYGYTVNNYPWWGFSMNVFMHAYKTCTFCAGCGYCVQRKKAVVGTYTVYDQLNGMGIPISVGTYHANACYVY